MAVLDRIGTLDVSARLIDDNDRHNAKMIYFDVIFLEENYSCGKRPEIGNRVASRRNEFVDATTHRALPISTNTGFYRQWH